VFWLIFNQKKGPDLAIFHGSPLGRQTVLSGVQDACFLSHKLVFPNHFRKRGLSLSSFALCCKGQVRGEMFGLTFRQAPQEAIVAGKCVVNARHEKAKWLEPLQKTCRCLFG